MKKAFTLIELAISLAIIALIMAAIFKGAEIINNAKIKKAFKDIKEIYDAYFEYITYSISTNGNEEIIGDGKDNGGYEDEADGYIDTNNTKLDMELLGIDLGTEIKILTNYDGTKTPYNWNKEGTIASILTSSNINPEIKSLFQYKDGKSGFIYNGPKGAIRVYFGKDEVNESGNLLIIYGLTQKEYHIFDTIVDGKSDGENGKFKLAGYKIENKCVIKQDSNKCLCSNDNTICVIKSIDGGCRMPMCNLANTKLIAIYDLRE